MDSSQLQVPAEEPVTQAPQSADEDKTPQRGDILDGVILSIDESLIQIDVGLSGPVHVPARELRRLPESRQQAIQQEATVSVYITSPQDKAGQMQGSIYQAFLNERWLRAEDLLANKGIWEGKVTGYNQGGLIVPFGKLRGFVPISHLLDMPRRGNPAQIRERLGHYVGRTLPLQVIEVDRRRRRLVFSYRRAYPRWREKRRQLFIDSLTEGEVRSGRVRELRDFGAFVDLGDGDGLIHISELAWHRVKHPKEVLRVGEEIQVYILRVNRKKRRVALSLRRLTPHPWSTVDERYYRNQLIEGRITRITSFGAFVELEPGIEGLLHVRQLPREAEENPANVIAEGETHLLRILGINSEQRRIRLSIRAVTPEEQMDWMARRAESEAVSEIRDQVGLDDLIGEEE